MILVLPIFPSNLFKKDTMWYNNIMNKKKCKECSLEKDISEFYGVQGDCKECYKNRIREYYQKNKDKIKLYDIKRNKEPKRKLQRLDYQRKQRKNNPYKYLARQKVLRALKKGELFKTTCEICFNKKVEAHHNDHNKPLDVNWLCKKHHFEADKLLRQN